MFEQSDSTNLTLDAIAIPGQASSVPARGFAQAEYEQRTARAQVQMAAQGFDALFFTTEHNMRYFTGFDSPFWHSPTRPWYLVVPAKGKPIAVIPEIGAVGMAATWIDDIRTWPAPRPDDDGISVLAQTLNELPRRHGRVGATTGFHSHLRMPADDFQRLKGELRQRDFADAAALITGLRNKKSEAEIDKIRFVCQLTSGAFEALPKVLRSGQSEREVSRNFRIDLLTRGADEVPFLACASGAGGYEQIILNPSARVLQDGDLLIIDTGATFDGYFCDFDRNFALGHADDATRRAYAGIYAATQAGFQAIRPGVRPAEIWAAMWAVLEEGGSLGNDVGRMGHGLGLQLTEGFSITEHDHTELEAGMVLTLEPGMMFASGKLMVHEENVVVTEDGAQWLTRRAPPELPIV